MIQGLLCGNLYKATKISNQRTKKRQDRQQRAPLPLLPIRNQNFQWHHVTQKTRVEEKGKRVDFLYYSLS